MSRPAAAAAAPAGGGAPAPVPHARPAGGIGARLILLAMAIGMAAVNTGNNLLYLVLAIVLALVAVSWLVSSKALSGLRVAAVLPEEVVRDEPFVAAVEAAGRFPLLPQTWLDVRLEGLPDPATLTFAIPSDSGRGIGSTRLVVKRRGVYEGLTLTAATGYPFDLWLRRARRLPWRGRLVVLPAYPRIRSLKASHRGRGPAGGESASLRADRTGVDLRDIRHYTTADDARRIDWRSTARAGRLMVKEMEREQERRIDLVLDLEAPGDDAFEAAVERCAAILDLARRERFDARLIVPGAPSALTGREAMTALAGARRAAGGLDAALRLARPGAEWIVVSADPARGTPVEMS